jgi:uncharacterized membrane-anchored protein
MTDTSNSTPAQSGLPLEDHPLRRALTEELHLRRFPPFDAPARLLQIVMHSGEDSLGADRAAAERLCALSGIVPPPGKHFVSQLDSVCFIWERHTEFTSYTFIKPGPVDLSFAAGILQDLPADWLASIPGRVLRATQIVVIAGATPEPQPDELAAVFSSNELVSCRVAGGGARLWSEFRVHDDGLGRLLIHNRALLAGDLSRLVQQVQELGNYRNMALLGLPEAQRLAPELTALDRRLGILTDEIAARARASDDDDRLLADLSDLSAEIARLTAKTSYRMSATEAYAELTQDRLRSIGGERVEGYPTLADFTERRLIPGVRTCRSFTRRLDDLANRTAWASSLLRTRVETTLERQSRDLLESMNQRTDLQLRLQQTVEGLSVVAISYYATALFSYVAHGLHELYPPLNAAYLTAGAVPVIMLVAAVSLDRMTRHLHAPRSGPKDQHRA